MCGARSDPIHRVEAPTGPHECGHYERPRFIHLTTNKRRPGTRRHLRSALGKRSLREISEKCDLPHDNEGRGTGELRVRMANYAKKTIRSNCHDDADSDSCPRLSSNPSSRSTTCT